jgi:hypothetical protein
MYRYLIADTGCTRTKLCLVESILDFLDEMTFALSRQL